MGLCELCESKNKIKEGMVDFHAFPMPKTEKDQLYSNKYAICEIRIETKDKNKNSEFFANGFLCELNEENIPFSKALFTNNQILDENTIKMNNKINFDICGIDYIIKITKDRRVFTNVELDYTCIEILDTDNINF